MKFQLLIAPTLFAFTLPLQAETAVQELEYQSVFEGYKTYSDSEIQNWPKAIQLVDEIGGWRVYSREPSENNLEGKPETGSTTGSTNGSAPQQTAPKLTPQPPQTHQHGGAK